MTKENDEQPGEKKPRVAKTMLYRKPTKSQDLPQEQEISPIAKTKLYRKPQASQDLPSEQEILSAQEPAPEKPKTKVARTKLDHKLLMNIKAEFGERQNERLQQEITKRELEPVKIIDPIKAEKTVGSCPFSWTEESAKERFKHCANCQKPIYHLEGLEPEQVDALVLKRENREKFVLYKRPDGKFMTSDCPVAQRRRLQTAGLVAAVCLCIITAVVVSIMMPPPPPPPPTADVSPPTPAPTAVTPEAASKGDSSSTSASTGTHHYEAGDPMPVVPTAVPPQNTPAKTFSEQEQRGDFWQFPNGQPTTDPNQGPQPSYGQ